MAILKRRKQSTVNNLTLKMEMEKAMRYYDAALIEENTIDLSKIARNFLTGLRKFFWLILMLAIIVAFIFCFYAGQKYVPEYTAAVTFTVNLDLASDGSIYEDTVRASQLSATFPYIITSSVLKNIIAEDLGFEALAERITAENVEDTNLFTIKVTSDSPDRAYNVLQSVIKNYPLIADTVVGGTHLNMIEDSGIPSEPSNPIDYLKLIKYGAAIGAAMGLLIITAYAFARKTIHKPDDLSEVTNIKFLGLLPHLSEKKKNRMIGDVRKRAAQNDKFAVEYMDDIYKIRTRLNKIISSKGIKSILVTSALPAEGKSTFALNLALSMAELSNKVILVDCDFRRPSLFKILPDLKEGAYLNDVLQDNNKLDDAIRYYDEYGISVLACNKPMPEASELPGAQSISEILQTLREKYDYIIIDSAPSAIVSDTLELAKSADGVIYIIRQDYSKVRHIQQGLEHIVESSRAEIIGCVLNNVRHMPLGYGYGYGYYGKYGKRYYQKDSSNLVTNQAE